MASRHHLALQRHRAATMLSAGPPDRRSQAAIGPSIDTLPHRNGSGRQLALPSDLDTRAPSAVTPNFAQHDCGMPHPSGAQVGRRGRGRRCLCRCRRCSTDLHRSLCRPLCQLLLAARQPIGGVSQWCALQLSLNQLRPHAVTRCGKRLAWRQWRSSAGSAGLTNPL